MLVFDILSTAQAAELLGVTPARVRQMVTEKKLRPLPLPGRESRFRRDRVERVAAQQRLGRTHLARGEAFTTPSLGDVPPAARTLVYDRLLDMPTDRPEGVVETHLRIWEGDDGWAVALLGTPARSGHGHLTLGRAELVAEQIIRLRPSLDLRRTAIAELLPGRSDYGQAWELVDVVFTINLVGGMSPFQESQRSFCEIDELVDAIGGQPVLWHRDCYTPEAIDRHQRLGRPIKRVLDRYGLQARDEQIRALEASSHEFSDLALDVLAGSTRMIVNGGAAITPPPDTDLDYLIYPWTPQGSYLEAIAIPEALREAVRTRGDKFTHAFATEFEAFQEQELAAFNARDYSPIPYASDRIARHRRELITLAEDTEESRPGADALVHAAAVAALGSLPYATVPNLPAWEELCERMPYPATQLLSWAVHDSDRVAWSYLDAALQAGGRDLDAHEITQLTPYAGSDGSFGRDLEGTPMVVRPRGNGTSIVSSIAPLRAQTQLQETDELVSARIDSGHIPLFIERGGRIIGVVPAPTRSAQMNYGYGGSGPGSAQNAILQHFTQSGLTVTSAVRRAVELFAEDPQWEEGTHARVAVRTLLEGTYTPGKRFI